MKDSIAKELQHLSSEKIEELYARYLAGEKNKDLIKEFGIDVHENKLLSLFPPVIHQDKQCPYCNIPMQSQRLGKKSYKEPVPECPVCMHFMAPTSGRYRRSSCECRGCIELAQTKKKKLADEQRSLIKHNYNINLFSPVEYDTLSFRDKFLLFTILRYQSSESMEYISSFSMAYSKSSPFSATDDYRRAVVQDVHERKILLVSSDSPLSAFYINSGLSSFYPDEVEWIPNISIAGERIDLSMLNEIIHSELCSADYDFPVDAFEELAYEIAKDEIIQYLQMQCRVLKIDFMPKKKTDEVSTELLKHFPVSKIYYFAKKAVDDAHNRYERGAVNSKTHAANTIPIRMQSLGERALLEKWNLKSFSRDSSAPQSIVNKSLYEHIIGDVNLGFEKSPAEIADMLRSVSKISTDENEFLCDTCGSNKLDIRKADRAIILCCLNCGVSERYNPEM